jgi:hypothetical protein
VVVSILLSLTAGAAMVGGRAELERRLAPLGGLLAPVGRAVARLGDRAATVARGTSRWLLRPVPTPPGRTRSGGRLAAAVRGAGAAVAGMPRLGARFVQAAWRDAHARPGRTLRFALAVAAVGFFAGTQIELTADQRRLLRTDSVEALDLASIERETGTPGDLNVIVRSDRLLDPAVVRWMSAYQRKVLRQNGFRAGRPCGEADLCPALSLTNLFGGGRQGARQIREAVAALPRYFSQNVITPDRRTANIAFRMGAMPPERRREIVANLRAELDPPADVDADLAGPVVTAADGEDDLARGMWVVTAAALLLVIALLAAASRSLEGALVVAIPLLLVAGWTFLILYLLPVDIDFLTSALAAIAVAVCAGPIVLAARRHRAAHAGGPPGGAETPRLRSRAAAHGAAFGAAAVAGFLSLIVSDIPALRDLGVAGAVTLSLNGLGLALVLPATLVWADRRGGLRVPRTRAELAATGRSLAGSMRAAVRATATGVRGAARAVRRGVPRAGRKVRAVVTSRR